MKGDRIEVTDLIIHFLTHCLNSTITSSWDATKNISWLFSGKILLVYDVDFCFFLWLKHSFKVKFCFPEWGNVFQPCFLYFLWIHCNNNNYSRILQDAESLPVMLLRNVCFFCDSGGPQAIKKCLEVRSKELTIPMLGHIVHCLSNVSIGIGRLHSEIFWIVVPWIVCERVDYC